MIVFLDPTRKYKFLIGHYFKTGRREKVYYQIIGIDEVLRWRQSTGAVTASSTTTKDWDTYLKPLDGYAYFIEKMGIEGKVGFQLQFPKGINHGTPRGEAKYLYASEAGKGNPWYYPIIVIPPFYPTWALNNPDTSDRTGYGYFFGEKWRVRKIASSEVTPNIEKLATEMTDYALGGIGQG